MQTSYNPHEYEDNLYAQWEQKGYFEPKNDGSDAFVIALPPPNVTGQLHAGHSMYTVEDIMIRYNRMKGKDTLWVPGTDHAAIATETVVLRNLGIKDRNKEISREDFMVEAKKFVEITGGKINHQLRKMGFSCDWTREAYTFDETRNTAVNEIFKGLYDKDLIYRGNRMINWSTGAQSVLADDELEWDEIKESFYYIQCGEFIMGTVRPETKCADSPLFINPEGIYIRIKYSKTNEAFIVAKNLHEDEKRWKEVFGKMEEEGSFSIEEEILGSDFIGQEFEYETYAGKRKFKVMGDSETIDMNKGTGAMTISSCHSADDYALAHKYDLKETFIQKIDFEGKMTSIAGPCEGMSIIEARKKSAKIMKEKGLIIGEDKGYNHRVPICYRSGCVVEPMISKQWFIAVDKEFIDDFSGETTTLKRQMQEAVRGEHVALVPNRFDKTYFHWIDNLQDWCISRQIWWGHQIPVWYDETGAVAHVGHTPADESGLTRDEDTLDTWFSSALWPFSIFGWPEKTEDFEKYYPNSVLETGHDIIFFWVARMIMFGRFATGVYPFHTVYLHGLVRDEKGQKMSKSKGNGIDPIDIIEEFGTDALRLSLVIGTTPGNNTNLGKEKIAGCRNFCNKLWNISRFILMQESDESFTTPTTDLQKWIMGKTQTLINEVNADLDHYLFGSAIEKLWDFTWNELADWAIEAAKAEQSTQTKALLKETLKTLLKLLHPFIPFVTESIWKEIDAENMLIISEYPKPSDTIEDIQNFERVKSLISKIRSMRKNAGVDATKKIIAHLTGEELQNIQANKEIIMFLARLETLSFEKESTDEKGSSDRESGIDIFLPLSGMMDAAQEKKRIEKELEEAKKMLINLEGRLSNEKYVSSAPAHLVEQTRAQKEEVAKKIELLSHEIKDFG